MDNPNANRKRLAYGSTVVLIALSFSACSRDQKPIAEAIKPAQQTMEAAKGVEQTLQKAQESREAQSPKE